MVEEYEQTLNNMTARNREKWAKEVFRKLQHELAEGDSITILAGSRYREHLVPMLKKAGYNVKVPLEGMSIGKQLQWMNTQSRSEQRGKHIERLYALLETLKTGVGGFRIMKDCTGRLEWPKLGVYFFFEPGEFRMRNHTDLRVVRVGTHAVSKGSRSTLWGRLRTHRGALDGTGNHRGSIFRLHVGAALIARSGSGIYCPSWGHGQSADKTIRIKEEPLERQVSKYIGAMSLLWLAVSDQPGPASDRAYIERNCIGLLAGLDTPSVKWLGNCSVNAFVRASGLWNVDYVSHQYDPRFLDVLEEYVHATIGISAVPRSSLAPAGWYSSCQRAESKNQLYLFEE